MRCRLAPWPIFSVTVPAMYQLGSQAYRRYRVSYYASPDFSGAHTLSTDADVTRARRLAAQLVVLFPDPAGSPGRRLPADAASSASRCGETLRHAGGDGSAVVSRPT